MARVMGYQCVHWKEVSLALTTPWDYPSNTMRASYTDTENNYIIPEL